METASIHTYVRNMMALPFLPAADIEPAFQLLALRANSEQLSRFERYMEEQWINHSIFDIDSLSVYGVSVRTINDTKGWHQSLNRKAGCQELTFYRLVPALCAEAENVQYELRYLREGQSTRRVRPVSLRIEKSIRDLWARYDSKDITTSELLNKCAKVYGPQVEPTAERTVHETLVTRL
ncbi:uncharacterized protein LOC127872697 [Dreissena polymorpha]|uniref:Uncharacterized protein n=1 Tax=Dreissena polymorpha TaxID=45954 RepID=A0A9D4R9F0_DREPO|nr:uncharacterized protein LOC127872697 [Dreissena polymorpha]KAH3859981.1 hypothetical protein DPMN_102802 [Dreissena polymorpha]